MSDHPSGQRGTSPNAGLTLSPRLAGFALRLRRRIISNGSAAARTVRRALTRPAPRRESLVRYAKSLAKRMDRLTSHPVLPIL